MYSKTVRKIASEYEVTPGRVERDRAIFRRFNFFTLLTVVGDDPVPGNETRSTCYMADVANSVLRTPSLVAQVDKLVEELRGMQVGARLPVQESGR